MRAHCGRDGEQGDCHESGNQQTLHGKLRWFDMQCGLHHRITANGHGRMWPASLITILFLTWRMVPSAHADAVLRSLWRHRPLKLRERHLSRQRDDVRAVD